MKTKAFVSLIIIIIFITSGCSKSNNIIITTSAAENDNPEYLYEKNQNIDMIVYLDDAYVNASNVHWINEYNLSKVLQLEKLNLYMIQM